MEAAKKSKIDHTTPLIGEAVVIDARYPRENWWTNTK
jgi:hypothetical protein